MNKPTRKITKYDLSHLILGRVKLTSCVLGQGSYGTVYKANHNGTACAAKQVDLSAKTHHNVVVERMTQNFLLECLQHSKLRHPNIVKMLGVFYPKKVVIPVLVMELMEYNLTQLLKNHKNISMYIKLSILQDVSRGLCYLHTQNPPIVHQALYSDNILLTKGLVAKIADFKSGSETVSDQALVSVRRNKGIDDFLPQSLFALKYDVSLNVFSFGCVICHVITQEWPRSLQRSSSFKPYVGMHTHVVRKQCYIIDDWSVNKHQNYIDQIDDNSLHQLVEACLQSKFENRPHMSLIYERITSIMIDHYNDDNIRKIYSLVMKEGLDQSKNFQLLLVGAENTGKTSLISSFLGEEFVEAQLATKGVNVDVCKVYCKDLVRISHSDKSNILLNQFSDQCKDNVLKSMTDSSALESPGSSSYNQSTKRSSITYSNVLFTNVPLTKSMTARPTSTSEDSFRLCPQYIQENALKAAQSDTDSLVASLWDFAGQTIYHNSHSVFISESGVSVITFNASMELTDNITPREGSQAPYAPECHTIISSIHHWLQVVNSVCSAKENVLLVGTHIDKLHPDLKKAREIASNKILPVLEIELCEKPYAQHIAFIDIGLINALKQSCFFISNKYRDEEIVRLQAAAVAVAASLREEKPIFFLKIEQTLLQLNKQVISLSTMLDLVVENTFALDKNSPEFKGILKYFHNNRIILHFSQIESLKDLVILSPNWLAKLFSYVIAAQSYNTGGKLDWAWKRLTKYGILHECLLQHMLDKFHSDYPVADLIQVTKQQAVDILLCFHLLARITGKAWFAEEGFPTLSDSGDTFIVPSLVRIDDRNPPETEEERIIYFMFNSCFIPTSLLNQLIAECICRSVRRNDPLLWMRRGKIGSQLGSNQKYYISRCVEKQSIQLTITVAGDDEEHIKERRDLINDIINILDEIMKVFMPATKERPSLLIPCPFCSVLHILLDNVCSGKTIFCPNANDKSIPDGYYGDLLQGRLIDVTTAAGVDRKLEVFTVYYEKLTHLDFKALGPHLVAARIISHEDHQFIQETVESSRAACRVLGKISTSLYIGVDETFDKFLSILESCDDSIVNLRLAEQMRKDLLNTTTVQTALTAVEQPSHQIKSVENFHEEIIGSTPGTADLLNTTTAQLHQSVKSSREPVTESTPLLWNPKDIDQQSSSQGVGYKCCNLI